MFRMVAFAVRAGCFAAALSLAWPAAAVAQGLEGCWRDVDPGFVSTVCFEPDNTGTFSMVWSPGVTATGAAGKCNGYVRVNISSGRSVAWEVPQQEGMCRISGRQRDLMRRTYDCNRSGGEITCEVRTYGPDGAQVGVTAGGITYQRN